MMGKGPYLSLQILVIKFLWLGISGLALGLIRPKNSCCPWDGLKEEEMLKWMWLTRVPDEFVRVIFLTLHGCVLLPTAIQALQIWTQVGIGADPQENCHLNVKKLPKTWHLKKKCQKIQNVGNFFGKNVNFLAFFWQSNGNFPEGQIISNHAYTTVVNQWVVPHGVTINFIAGSHRQNS